MIGPETHSRRFCAPAAAHQALSGCKLPPQAKAYRPLRALSMLLGQEMVRGRFASRTNAVGVRTIAREIVAQALVWGCRGFLDYGWLGNRIDCGIPIWCVARLRPFTLRGAGALYHRPTGDGHV
jgi:hypothetical protein